MWKSGEVIAWRGVFRGRVWNALPLIVVSDGLDELILALLPGAECFFEKTYPRGKTSAKRRWEFVDNNWILEKYIWRSNRLLLIFEPKKYYSTILFWQHTSNEFLGYYINFQLPFQRSHSGFDTLDLDLDIDIKPDFNFMWKDEDDYRKAIDHGAILPEWIQEIDNAKPEIFDRLEKRQYPFDGSWLDWKPDPDWEPPKLPENWDKI